MAMIVMAAAQANRRICRHGSINRELRLWDFRGIGSDRSLVCRGSYEKTGRPPVFFCSVISN